jgi:hypothetical protein
MDLDDSLAYQLAATFSRDMMNDLARVVSSPPVRHHGLIRHEELSWVGLSIVLGYDGGTVLYCGGHGANCRLSAKGLLH